jgi:hypothetical protein
MHGCNLEKLGHDTITSMSYVLTQQQIYHVESEKWLGGLLHANDELVQALMTFEQLDRSIDADSDSDDDIAEQAHLYRSKSLQLPFI